MDNCSVSNLLNRLIRIKGVVDLAVGMIDSIKGLLLRGQATAIEPKPRLMTIEQSVRSAEIEEKWRQLGMIRDMYNVIFRSEQGSKRFMILYYMTKWPIIQASQVNSDSSADIRHTTYSLAEHMTWLKEEEIYQCITALCKSHWLKHDNHGHLEFTSLGAYHFNHILVAEAENFQMDFELGQALSNFENRNSLGTSERSTIASFSLAIERLYSLHLKLNRVLENIEPSAINNAASNAETYLEQMRQFRSRIIDVGILESNDPMVRFSYLLLGKVANQIQDIRKIKDRLDASFRGRTIIHYDETELDYVLSKMLDKSNIEKAIVELSQWVDGAGANELPLILDTGSLIPALETIHHMTQAMNREEESYQENGTPTRREQQVSFKTEMDYYLENLLSIMEPGSTITTSKIIPHEQKGQTLLNLSIIKWLSGNSADLRRKYGGPLLKYIPLGIRTKVPEFKIELMDDAEIKLLKERLFDE